jgi:hypothetical protein
LGSPLRLHVNLKMRRWLQEEHLEVRLQELQMFLHPVFFVSLSKHMQQLLQLGTQSRQTLLQMPSVQSVPSWARRHKLLSALHIP